MVFSIIMLNSCTKDEKKSDVINPPNTVTDIDGNVYRTVVIGTQTWMAENLKVTRYRNGDTIPNYADPLQWAGVNPFNQVGAYCNYMNDESYVSTYGRLYNWFAATDVRVIAPIGWHIPTDEEWRTLSNYLGGDDVAGGKLKEAGTTHWQTLYSLSNNESGFTGLPAGIRGSYIINSSQLFFSIGIYAGWWSAEWGGTGYITRFLHDSDNVFRKDHEPGAAGLSIRCIKD